MVWRTDFNYKYLVGSSGHTICDMSCENLPKAVCCLGISSHWELSISGNLLSGHLSDAYICICFVPEQVVSCADR